MKNRWMKAAALAVCLAFSFPAAARADETARTADFGQLENLHAALDRTAGLTSYDWTQESTASYSGIGVTLTVTGQSQFQAAGVGTDGFTALRREQNSALGMTEETVSFYTGGCYYGEEYGFPMKSAMDPDAAFDALAGLFFSKEGSGICDALAPGFSAPSVTSDGDSTVYTYVAGADFLAEISGEGPEQYSVLAVQFYVGPDGYVDREKMEVRAWETEGDQRYDMVLYLDGHLNSPGSQVSISLPSTEGYGEWN